MFDALRILSPLVHPVGLAWSVIVVLGLCACRKPPRRIGVMLLGFALVAWLLAQPRLVHPLLAPLEQPWEEDTVETAPSADAIVVLGGGWRPSANDYLGLELTPAADRWIVGLELARQGKAPWLVVGGDDASAKADAVPDSQRLRAWLARWRLDGISLETLGPVRNTRDEAARTRELAVRHGWRRILLVTSAFHMTRAVEAFRREGLEVHPVACDFQILRGFDEPPGWKGIPDEESLTTLALGWHEWLGRAVYNISAFFTKSPSPTPPPLSPPGP